MQLNFTKMHGLGNDFVVVNAFHASIELSREQIQFLANRRTGVGCDQLLMVEPPSDTRADFNYRIFNADGGEVEHCGNGARCFALFVRDQQLTDKTCIAVNTSAGLISLRVEADQQVTVNMGVPNFEPAGIPFIADTRLSRYPLEVNDESFLIGAASIGNPHAVIDVDDVVHADVERIGASIESHPRFPQRVNVGFRQRVNDAHIRLRVFERGVGETRACGTGACAAVVTGIAQDELGRSVRVSLPGGDLMVNWAGEGSPVMMTGPAQSVYQGTIEL